ncbi:MAG: dihydroorotase [Propionibacteriaceae bacterium]|jgi:dihydroorotase|nr:dihydroorotase [Propionibacteriaceae bacterium]
MSDIILRQVGLPGGGTTDIGISGGLLADPDRLQPGDQIDASGLILLPGLVDLHTHLREPDADPAETIASGTAAAARGGFTAVFAMANTNPVTDSAARVRGIQARSQSSSAEVVPIGAISQGLAGLELADIVGMHQAGVTVFSDDGHCLMNSQLMEQALYQVGQFHGVIAEHCQDHDLASARAWRPTGGQQSAEQLSTQPMADPFPTISGGDEDWPRSAEAVMVARDIQLAQATGSHIHLCHLSTAESVDLVRWAKSRDLPVTAEVTPHHLLLDHSMVMSGDTTFKVNPPLRDIEDRLALRQALADGIIDIVGTDHAPHRALDKTLPINRAKPGMIGLEYALAVVIETMVLPGLIDWPILIERMSVTPAKIGGIADHQGRPVMIGEPANLTLIDPTRRQQVDRNDSLSLGRNNPYHGLDLPDPVMATWLNGRLTWQHEALTDRRAGGPRADGS